MQTDANLSPQRPTQPGDPCLNCGRATVKITPETLKMIRGLIGIPPKSVTGPLRRRGEKYYLICPYCDAYGLGSELEQGFPFVDQAGQTHTVQDITDW